MAHLLVTPTFGVPLVFSIFFAVVTMRLAWWWTSRGRASCERPIARRRGRVTGVPVIPIVFARTFAAERRRRLLRGREKHDTQAKGRLHLGHQVRKRLPADARFER